MIGDSLLIAGGPFKPFTTVVTQKDEIVTSSEFKFALRKFKITQVKRITMKIP